MVGQYSVIDAHCHVYPDAIAERAVAGTGNFYSVPFAMDGTERTLRKAAEAAGIDHCVIQSVATSPRQVKSINEFIARTVKEGEGRYTGLGTLHPDSQDIEGDVMHLKELGLHGVKLHPDIQRFPVDDERCTPFYELCSELELPILIHTGDKRYDYSNPNRLIPLLRRFPKLTVIGAHLGGWSIWEEASDQLKEIPNLYFDCSSSFPWIGPEKVERIIRKLGADRVMFGTDYPMWEPKLELEVFFRMKIEEPAKKAILAENAKRIFKIE